MNSYAKIQEIGKGSFGSVLLMRDVTSVKPTLFAMKRFQCADANKMLENMQQLMKINHPNLVELHDVIKCDENVVMMTVYCEQGDLKTFLSQRNGKLLHEERVWTWLSQLASALDHLEKNNIIHRDIKPQNILLSNNAVKLSDTGLGQVLETCGLALTSVISMAPYLAPELFNDPPLYSFKSDIWALACVVYEMCALKPAFVGIHGQVADVIRKNNPRPLSDEFSLDLKNIVSNMMKSDTNARPAASGILTTVAEHNLEKTLARDIVAGFKESGKVKGKTLVVVVGESGCGKSTFLNYVAGCKMTLFNPLSTTG